MTNMSTSQLDAPMVYLAPEKHAFLVLGEGDDPVITWSTSYRFACEQADVHGALVVAVPIVHDTTWMRPHPSGVAVPARTMPRKNAVPLRVPGAPEPTFEGTGFLAAPDADGVLQIVDEGGYPLGRAARGGQGNPDGWSSARPDVVGQEDYVVPAGERAVGQAPVPLTRRAEVVERVVPFGDPDAPPLPEDREAALLAAFGGNEEAVAALHATSQADHRTVQAVADFLHRKAQ